MITIKQFVFNFFGENTYLLYDHTSEAVLIDCGCMIPKEEEVLSGFIKDNRLVLKRLLCTHYHFDHVIGNTFIFCKYGIRPEIHRDEVSADAPTLQMQAAKFGRGLRFEEIEPVRFLEDDEEIRFGESVLKTILIPGHSPASLVYYIKAGNFVISGDVLFPGSIGRTDLFGGNYNKLITGIKNRLLPLPGETVIYPGHGPSTTIGFEKANNPYL